jgi:hypothetical protein
MRAIISSLSVALWLCTTAAIAAAQKPGFPAGGYPHAQIQQTQTIAANADEKSGPRQPPPPRPTTTPGSLSQELNRSGGVIQPPPSADRNVMTPPNQGTSRMPVIPPPGTPGGNPRVQPK